MADILAPEPGFALPKKVVAVAIDWDNNSKHAAKWAVANLFPNKNSNASLVLIHVRKQKRHIVHMNSTFQNGHGEPIDAETTQLFKGFRAYSSRKGINAKEVVIVDNDVSKALIDYIEDNIITNIVFGASTRNDLLRESRSHDVPTKVNASAPAFCTVYVISETEIRYIRPALVPAASFRCLSSTSYREIVPCHFPDEHSEPEDERKIGSKRSEWRRPINKSIDLSKFNVDTLFRGKEHLSGRRHSLGNHRDFPQKLIFESIDDGAETVDFTSSSESDNEKDIKAKVRRMKLELKQTRGMYKKVCREVVIAKNKAQDIHEWKLQETRKLKQARLLKEAAFALVEKEKAISRAAIEAAGMAQKLASMEAERRIHAELKVKKEAEAKNRALNALSNNDVSYRKYTLEEIVAATDNFSDSLKIGEGAYGPVYKGKLDHTTVAIKVLRSGDEEGKKQFKQEVEVLSRMRHPNMVLLVGACPQYGCLVYEYMNNGSLEDRLFRKGNTPPMSWRVRFKIAADIATGLSFLHCAKPEALVHRDLKPASILLDRTYSCKISDVGLSRLVPASLADSVTENYMTKAVGTFWYMDPEYQQSGNLSVKSDIYSLGVMLLQILTARPPMGLIQKVQSSIVEGTFEDVLDPGVPCWPVEEALILAKVALQCVELKKKDRPDLCSVILPELNRLKEIGENY